MDPNKSSAKVPSKTIGTKQDIKYEERVAVRAIVQNDNNQIIIIHAKRDNYYKLPGGGIEANEDHVVAVRREVLEETGCLVDIEGECIGVVKEWRNDLHQFSYCYVGKLVEDTGAVELTQEELGNGLRHEWIGVGKVVERMKNVEPTFELGRCIGERDGWIVGIFLGGGKGEMEGGI